MADPDDPRTAEPLAPADAHHLSVRRTARYFALGPTSASRIVVALHGYGQQARFFARHFRALAQAGHRVLVPEALSRFYLDDAYERIGASWMTREDRAHEVRDQLGYLDSLVRAEVGSRRSSVHLTVLGFSQGAAAACRWAAGGSTRVDRVVVWGGDVPDDLDLERAKSRLPGLTLVVGDEDRFATAERIGALESRLRAAAVPFERVGYAGGHRLQADAMRRTFGLAST
jgi:dienelactone hydrolase